MNPIRHARSTAAVVVTAVLAVLPLTATPTASAEEPRPAFYEAPATLPAANGDLIRSEKLDLLLDPVDGHTVAFDAQRVLYRSTNRTGKPVAVSGSIFVPKAKWVGPGTRPVIGYAVGTQGIGDSCAPSRVFSELFEYESFFMAGLLARGYAIAMTDYEGLGTAGMHTYMDRVSQGRAVIDIVRAAQRMPSTGLTATSPVAFAGYSQGGAGAASAAELAGSYAPGMKVKGTVASAVPADLRALPDAIDGSLYSLFTWFAIAGLTSSYGIDMTPYLNAKGTEMFAKIADDCVFDLLGAAFTKSSDYTADGAGLAELIKRAPFDRMIADQRIGTIKPNAPVLVTHSHLDDVVPHRVATQLTKDWCNRGATVRLSSNLSPLHVGGMLNHATEIYAFLEARFAGLPAASSCWRM
ncbi:lipase family protein [Nocardioides daphniae]|uniref:Lipase n=1 Tax=Nocardioides daphniae TaxID=402297 RepID=A0A4P7UDV8_9ACTN|nr:lipase family protein [Nocardioides daphniae]QCC77565.1 lipase [Nocardioides daphniae]GGD30735.1 lipase [Nocardioides daphniae]